MTRWHAYQVRRNVRFHFQREIIEYCKSDVALLKAGCEAFQQEFERQAGFNPMAKCITIVSACNLYWRKHHLTPNTIAVEPFGGWRGAKVNQSLKALQWLYYQEHQIPKQGASADRIRHVRNGGDSPSGPSSIPISPSTMLPRTEALKNCIKPLYPKAWPCSKRVTLS